MSPAFLWRLSAEGCGTALLVEGELAGHKSPAKSHSLCTPVERRVGPSTACKMEHGCFPGHLLKANIWLAGLWHSTCHLGKWSCWLEQAVKEKQLRAWHSLQASETHTGLCC